MNNITSSVFDFGSMPDFRQIAPPLKQYPARDGAALSYRFYESFGKENVFIFLHGSGYHGEYLHNFADFLSREKSLGQVYVPNLRGHFNSGAVRGDCSYIGQLEDDLFDLVEYFRLQNKKIILVGHSSGGGLAIRVAGGSYHNLIHRYVLLSPAIPTAPTMRQGTAGGWANVSTLKIIALSILNSMGVTKWNHTKVICFNIPPSFCDGTETLSYTFNLNTSYHPRLPYQKDIDSLKGKFILFVGENDEANDPYLYSNVMQDSSQNAIRIIEQARHLDIVNNPQVMQEAAAWIKAMGKP